MTHLEKGLHDHFARLQNAPSATTNGTGVPSTAPTSVTDNSIADAGTLGTPFARVNSVEPGSPAHQAGLKMGDSIRGFGSVHWLNHERLSKVAEAVQQNEGVCSALFFDFCVPTFKLTLNPASSDRQSGTEEREWIGNNGVGSTTHPTAQLGRSGPTGVPSSAIVKALISLLLPRLPGEHQANSRSSLYIDALCS